MVSGRPAGELLLGIAKVAMMLADKALPGRKLVRGILPDGGTGEGGSAA